MITKEQLAKENGELRAQVQTWDMKDGTLRRRFAKVLGETENQYGIGSDRTPKDLSWEEIFCELGKLISVRDFRSWKDNIEFQLNDIRAQFVPKSE